MSSRWGTAAAAAGLSLFIAGAVNFVLLFIASLLTGALVVSVNGREQTIGLVEVFVVTLAAAIVGALGSAILSHWSWGLRVVAIGGLAVTLLSLGGVINATTPTAAIALGMMHLVTGATIVFVNVFLHSRRGRAVQSAG